MYKNISGFVIEKERAIIFLSYFQERIIIM